MRWVGTVTGAADAETARARIRDVARWSEWLDGEVTPTSDGARVQFAAPVPVTVRVAVSPTEVGARLALIEGDLSDLDIDVAVRDVRSGCEVVAQVNLGFPVAVPGTMLRELDGRLLPAWLSRLAQ